MRSKAATLDAYLPLAKLDIGKSCPRFRQRHGLRLDVIAAIITTTPPEKLIAHVTAAQRK